MSEANKDSPLAGKGIVVTRPRRQAAHLAELIRAAGGRVILFPVIEIADIDDMQPIIGLIDRLEEFDRAIFISPNAVYKAMTLITARRSIPRHLTFAAVGQATVRELGNFGVTTVTAPARFDSEALLEMPEMKDAPGKRMVIFRGVGGRELLGETLAARGAIVEYAECYRRMLPRADPGPLRAAWEGNELHAIVVTSSEGLRNLYELIGTRGRPWLQKTPLFVPHARIADAARELAFATVVQTTQGDDGLVEGLQQWFAART